MIEGESLSSLKTGVTVTEGPDATLRSAEAGKTVVLPLTRQDGRALFYGSYGEGVAGYGAVDGDRLTGESV